MYQMKQQNIFEKDANVSPSKRSNNQTSPVKGVVAALSKHRVSQEPLMKPVVKVKGLKVPTRIEDVPFRRQDRRILNGRKKRIVARRIIGFGIAIGILLIMLGSGLLTLYFLYQDGIPPFIYRNWVLYFILLSSLQITGMSIHL